MTKRTQTGSASYKTARARFSRRSTRGSFCEARRRWPCAWNSTTRRAAPSQRFWKSVVKVKKVYYPGSASHPQHALARRQQHGFGGMVSFDVGSLENAKTVLEAVKLCTLAESLGGVETLISHPATMTHASVDEAKRQRIGITDGLVRISVGIEDTDDIIADLDQALDKIA